MEEKIYNDFQIWLNTYLGVGQRFYNPLFRNLEYSEGFKYFLDNAGNGAHWFLTIIGAEILPKLKEDFYLIYLIVNQDETAQITVQRDIGEPILYEKHLEYTDCPPNVDVPYKFYLDHYFEKSVIILPSEY